MREFAHPVAQVCRDLGTPHNVLYPWASQHQLTKAYGTTRPYELYIERGCREGCTLEDWLDAERDMLNREFAVNMIARDGDPIRLVFHW